MNFISLACDVFLCFVPLCTIFISSADAVQEFRFLICQPPPAGCSENARSGCGVRGADCGVRTAGSTKTEKKITKIIKQPNKKKNKRK